MEKELNGLNALVIPGGESTVMIKLMVEFEMYDSVKRFGEQVRQKKLYTQVLIVNADYVGGRASRFLARVLGVSCFPSQLTECQIKRPCNSWIYLLTGI